MHYVEVFSYASSIPHDICMITCLLFALYSCVLCANKPSIKYFFVVQCLKTMTGYIICVYL